MDFYVARLWFVLHWNAVSSRRNTFFIRQDAILRRQNAFFHQEHPKSPKNTIIHPKYLKNWTKFLIEFSLHFLIKLSSHTIKKTIPGNKTSNGWESRNIFDTRHDDGTRCAKKVLSVESQDDDDNSKHMHWLVVLFGRGYNTFSCKCSAGWKICECGNNPISRGNNMSGYPEWLSKE